MRRRATDDADFRDGGRFDPERWLLPREIRPVPHDDRAFVPFWAAPRLRLGRHLALLEIRTVLAMLYRNFEVEPVPGPPVEERLAFTMVPANLSVRLKRRTSRRSTRRLRAFAAARREPVSSLERRRPMR
ncbi:MAG: cytochrome P450 [Rhodospirillales bacterium]|nr:cytochrome P450 [Rhodospirillales bacterium]